MLSSHKKETSTDTYYSVNTHQKQYAKWKKPDTKESYIVDSIKKKYPE